ncbi:MAG TPA: CBS domain-containing protein, partial [Methylomirabilota bacterium]|nr:CBS domain-containing protein [Methylomirabilota bacterium]
VAAAHPSAATTLSVAEIAGRLDRVPVQRVVAPTLTAVGPRTALPEAIRLMRARRQPALPVVRGGELLGVLAEDDLLELLADLLESEAGFVTIR